MPNTGLDDLAIAQQACVQVGIDPIAEFQGDSAEQKVLTSRYETTVKAHLTSYHYGWTRVHRQLFPSNTPPLAEGEKAYVIPNDSIDEETLLVNDVVGVDYQRYNEYLYANTTDDDTVILRYHYRVLEAFWPPIFAEGMVISIAALLKSGVQEKAQEAVALQEMAEGLFTKAQNVDSRGQTNTGFRLNTFGTVRRGGSRRRRLR